ncbi:MAG: hypothetical protein D6795_16565 [Deltaproteobacteria bacterium]|nr:MAG: hypothetical protein D6795_16565 [Deltaproteobacteria bacterium]
MQSGRPNEASAPEGIFRETFEAAELFREFLQTSPTRKAGEQPKSPPLPKERGAAMRGGGAVTRPAPSAPRSGDEDEARYMPVRLAFRRLKAVVQASRRP